MLRCSKLAREYKKKKRPLNYAIAFDGIDYSKEDRDYLWRQLVITLIKLHQSNLQKLS